MPMLDGLRQAGRDTWLLFTTRFIRLFAYGALSVVLVLYLIEAGLTESEIGLLLTLTLLADTAVSLAITTRADRMGRRRMLIGGAILMTAAGAVFASTRSFWWLLVAATVGVISPSGQEVGPFLPIEQAALSRVAGTQSRTDIFGWYTLVGALATALGALAAGSIVPALQQGQGSLAGYRAVVALYAVLGVALAVIFSMLSSGAEAPPSSPGRAQAGLAASLSGLTQSRPIVARLSRLFALDAFGGGFVSQGLAAYWFHLRFGAEPAVLGPILFGANILAGVSALVASRIAARFGLIRTMVWTHLPSNVLLILIPLMPSLPLAVLLLLVRFSISQMDVPTRQSYVMAVVAPDERSAAAGITGVARTLGAAISPLFAGLMFARPSWINVPFFVAGVLKIAYDVLLYRRFVAVQPREGAG